MTRQGGVQPLPPSFFHRPSEVVAADLLGTLIISEVDGLTTAGRVVETEAYLGYRDPASHGYQYRRHAGNRSLYAPPGTWYVYRSYGVHWCANLVSTAVEGDGSAVLIRALEPVRGLAAMRRRRGDRAGDRGLCSGPGKLTQALGIEHALDGVPMHSAPVVVYPDQTIPPARRLATPRIGISKAADWPLRFVVRDSPWLSRTPSGRRGSLRATDPN